MLLLQHVAPKMQRPKYRFVARNAATRRFFCKNELGFADCPKELEELFCRSCKNKLRFVAGCKNSLAFADKSQGGVGGKPTSSNTATKPTSSTTATTPTEPPRDAQSGATLRRGRPPDTAKQPAFWYCTDLAFGYLRSDKFQSARPPDDKQSPKPSGRPPDGERPHELRGWISKTTGGQPYGATTKMAQSQDTDGRGGNKEFTPRGQDQGWDFHWDFAQPSQVVRGGTPWGGLPSQGFGFD